MIADDSKPVACQGDRDLIKDLELADVLELPTEFALLHVFELEAS